MSSPAEIDSVLEKRPWREVNGPSLLSAVAALQLLPENQSFSLKLHVLAAIAVRLPKREKGRPITASMLRGMLKDPILQDPDGNDDFLISDPFCSEVELVGMPFRVLAGSSSPSSFKAESLIQSIVKITGENLPVEFLNRVHKLAIAVFGISEEMCARTRIERTISEPTKSVDRVTVPSTKVLEVLSQGVQFKVSTLPDGVLDMFRPMSTTTGEPIDLYPEAETDTFGIRPFHLSEEFLTISAPGDLATALMCEVQRLAIEAGCLFELAQAHRSYLAKRLAHTADLGPLEVEQPMDLVHANATLVVTRVQGQRIIFVVLADTFADYKSDSPFGMWTSTDSLDEIAAAIPIEDDEPVVLISPGSTTRGHMSFLPATESQHWLILDPHNVEMLLKFAWNDDPWELVRFARAATRLDRTTRVISQSELGLYGLYADHEDSFYLSDEALPETLMIAGDYGLSTQLQARRRLDEHRVRAGGRTLTAISLSGTEYAPIYALIGDGFPSLSVELSDLFIWIRLANEFGSASRFLLEGIAYWVWQVFEALGQANMPSRELRVLLDNRSGEGAPISVTRQSAVQFTITIRPDSAFVTVPHQNDFDRALVGAIVRGIAQPFLAIQLDESSLVEQISPHGNKRMFLIGRSSIPEMYDPDLARYSRLIAKSVNSAVLDDLGRRLFGASDVAIGDISERDSVPVLNQAVAIAFRRLVELAALFDSDAMLIRLIAQGEGLEVSGRLEDVRRLTRVACYGEELYPASKLREQKSRRVETSIAVRFLVEYLSASSSSGNGVPNDDEHDTLCALAQEITTLGMLSDARHYGLSQVTVSRLSSGRLGTSRDDRYATGLISFSELNIARALQGASDPDDDDSEWSFSSKEDEAFTAEFGFSVAELQTGIAALYEGFDANGDSGVVECTQDDAIRAVSGNTGWDRSRAEKFLNLFTLSASPPFSLSPETAPWRFGRVRSYLRQPLVRGVSDQAVLRWGKARLLSAVFDLVMLYRSGRLKATSTEMKSMLGSVRQSKNNEFERKVAAKFRHLGHSDVRERVRVVGGKRLVNSEGEDLGDIDVLVVDMAARELLVVEAKDFETARTPIEMSREMAKLKDDAVPKNHRRAEWIRSNLDLFVNVHDSSVGKWAVKEIIVTSRPSTAVATGNGHETVVAIQDL